MAVSPLPGPSGNVEFFLWLRHLTGLKLTEVHRRHLGTQLRHSPLPLVPDDAKETV